METHLYPNSSMPRACEVARNLGIDPDRMPDDGHDETGYLTVITVDGEPLGAAVVVDGLRQLERHPWPNPEAWTEFKAAWDADRAERLGYVIAT